MWSIGMNVVNIMNVVNVVNAEEGAVVGGKSTDYHEHTRLQELITK